MSKKPQEVLESQREAVTSGTSTDAEELSDELLEIDLSTVDDTTVRGKVTKVRSLSDKIFLKAEVPGGETVSERMTKPIPWSTRHKFARIVEDRGYGPGTAHHLVDEEILITRTSDDDWEFKDPMGTVEYIREHYRKELLGVTVGTAVSITLAVIGSLMLPEGVVAVIMNTVAAIFPLILLTIMGMYCLSIVTTMNGRL